MKKIKEPRKVPMLEFLEQLSWSADCMANDGFCCLGSVHGCLPDMCDSEIETFCAEFAEELDQVQCGAQAYVEALQELQMAYATKYPDKVSRDYEHYIQKDTAEAR